MRRTRTHRHTHLHHTSTISTTTWPPPPPAVGSCIPQPPPPPPPSSHHRHVPLTMVVVVIVVVMVVMVSCVAGHNGELCVVETPLRTPYVRSHRVTPTTCLGCLFLPHHHTTTTTTESYDQVHVIEVEEAVGGVVEVGVVESNIGGDDKVVVVILSSSSSSSSSSVLFKVFLSSSSSSSTASTSRQVRVNATKFVFLVNEGDVLEVDGLQYSLLHQPLSSSTGDVISTARQQFGFVSSYTRVRRANEVTLHLLDGSNSKNSGGCSSGSGGEVVVEEASPVVECEVVEEQAMSGCYHLNMLGRGDRDIHIIEVEKSIHPNSSLILSLVGGGEGVVERNVTLVLRASSPTTWHLHTTQLHGTVTLLMGGSDQVENISAIPGAVAVQVRKVDVPKNFDQLILTVLTSMGPPVSYTRSSAPTRITITVARRMENHIHSHPHPPDYEAPTVYAEEPGSVIRAGLSVTCDPTAMTLALPYATAEKVGSIAMALSDRACVGSRNGTHIVLRAEFTQCKFSATVSPLGKVTFDNMLSVELGPALSDDEDLVGSGYGSEDEYYPPAIPPMRVACPGEQVIAPPPQPRPPQPPPPPPPHQRKQQGSSGGMRGATYTMVMYRDSGLLEPLTTPPLHHHTSTSMPTPVVLHSRLYVQAALASVLFRADSPTSSSTTDLRVVLEECWVSNTTSPSPPPPTSASASTHTATHPRTLVRKSCRVDSSVAVDSPYAHSHTPTFSFQVLPEYAAWGTFYLHCQVGVCSTDSLPRPAVIRCIEPTLYCSKPALLHVFQGQPASSSLQTLTLGPLTTAATTKSALFGGVTRATTSTQGLNNKNSSSIVGEAADGDDKTQIVVLGGLSTEIVVGIALASFVIGVCLTATLWVIHMKTDPRRQKRHPDSSSAPRNSGYDLSAHSGSSTPSSQAPMTA